MNTRFLVVGNGQPASAVVREILGNELAALAGLLTSDNNSEMAARLAVRGVPVHPEAMVGDLTALEAAGLLEADWLLCANTTKIVPASVLAPFSGRALNFHPGPLPEYAGLHTHQWAIRNGESEFGVTVHFITAGLDTGDIVAIERFSIMPDDTGLSLFSRCMKRGTNLFAGVLRRILAGKQLPHQPQDLTGRRLYRHGEALDGRIDWNWSARRIADFARAGNYHPFTSPTYTARLDDLGAEPVLILAASLVPANGHSGSLIEIESRGPVIGCGQGEAVVLLKALRGNKPLKAEEWHSYFAELGTGAHLKGRAA